MTITMSLEIEEGLELEDIASILSAAAIEYCVGASDVTGNFTRSNTFFVFHENSGFHDVAAEGIDAEWKVGVRGAFHCPTSALAESSEDIRYLLLRLFEMSSSRFVLSFQYESIYVVRDDSGLHFLKSMVD